MEFGFIPQLPLVKVLGGGRGTNNKGGKEKAREYQQLNGRGAVWGGAKGTKPVSGEGAEKKEAEQSWEKTAFGNQKGSIQKVSEKKPQKRVWARGTQRGMNRIQQRGWTVFVLVLGSQSDPRGGQKGGRVRKRNGHYVGKDPKPSAKRKTRASPKRLAK